MAKNNKEKLPAFVKRDAIISGENYRAFITSLKDKYRRSQIKAAVKINTSMLEFYWEMGREISILKTEAKWGSSFFDCISLDMKAEFPGEPGFSVSNIRYVYRWYQFYNKSKLKLSTPKEEILQRPIEEFRVANNQDIQSIQNQEDIIPQRAVEESPMPQEFGLIPWGQHIDIFTKSHSVSEALFYIEETIRNNWSRPEVNFAIDNDLYSSRGSAVTNFDEKLPEPFSELAKEILKSPYNLSFIEKPINSEKQLEEELCVNISRFLLELGQGFAYIGRQMELKMPSGQVFIPDMIFYHTRLHCYIVCELKNTAFIPEFAGKLNFYVSAVDELMKGEEDNPTIGLLICKSKDNTIAEWSFRGMNQPMGVAEYVQTKAFQEKLQKYLPSEESLKRIIESY